MLLEIENVVDAGAAPAIDRLIVISDDTYISSLVGQQANQVELRSVGVLELVDENVRKSSASLAPNPGSFTEQRDWLDDEVVEIHRMHVLESRVVRGVDAGGRLVVLVALGP